MSDDIQANTTERLTPCLQKKIDKTTYLIEAHFSSTSTQSVADKLKRVILHDLEHGKQGKSGKSDESMVRFYVVRHGQTLLNSLDRAQGWADLPLTKTGKQIAADIGHKLIGTDFGAACI